MTVQKMEMLPVGNFLHGKTNSLCDVPGVMLGVSKASQKTKNLSAVTAILPHKNIFQKSFAAASFVQNGAGECSGLHQLNEWGKLETPILLSHTHGVGTAYTACIKWLMKKYPAIGRSWPVAIPVVGECDDSLLNDITKFSLSEAQVITALTSAKKQVLAGDCGGGQALSSCGVKAGSGSSSRILEIDSQRFHLSLWMQSNWGIPEELKIFGKSLDQWGLHVPALARVGEGSLISVLATDAPLDAETLKRLAKRAALGIARCGNTARHSSGEFFIAFSTSRSWKRQSTKNPDWVSEYIQPLNLSENALNQFFACAADVSEEAYYQSLFSSLPTWTRKGQAVPALRWNFAKSHLELEFPTK
jgi:D-aminopeptidase